MTTHSHITYEIQLIADPHLAPSVQEVAQFFSGCLPTTSVTAKRGRPRKTRSDGTPTSEQNGHVLCGEQLFSVNRSDKDVADWIEENETAETEVFKMMADRVSSVVRYPSLKPIPVDDVTIIDNETA